jgi:hypothetical protein
MIPISGVGQAAAKNRDHGFFLLKGWYIAVVGEA